MGYNLSGAHGKLWYLRRACCIPKPWQTHFIPSSGGRQQAAVRKAAMPLLSPWCAAPSPAQCQAHGACSASVGC